MALKNSEKRSLTGMVLSGGGARGYAHLGALKALNEEGIFPEILSGTSAGAIAGVLYADGYKPDEILKILSKNSKLDFMSFSLPRAGLMSMTGMTVLLRETLRAKTFEELKIPLFVAATDLNNGIIKYFSKGELISPVVASASIPVVFRPVVIDKISYVDGGVIDNLPIAPIEKRCEILIGSYVNHSGKTAKLTSLLSIAERAFHLSVSKDIAQKKRRFDLYIAPEDLINFNAFDQGKARDIFDTGYVAAKKSLEEYRSRQRQRVL